MPTKTVSVIDLARELPSMTLSHEDRTTARMALQFRHRAGHVDHAHLPEAVVRQLKEHNGRPTEPQSA